MNVLGWVVLIILGGVILYQIFGLDESIDPMVKDHVEFNIKKPEKDDGLAY